MKPGAWRLALSFRLRNFFLFKIIRICQYEGGHLETHNQSFSDYLKNKVGFDPFIGLFVILSQMTNVSQENPE